MLLARAAGSVEQLVKVLVVAEDYVPSHVEQEALGGHVCAGETSRLRGLQGHTIRGFV